jgi:hypothetical protein
LPEFGLEAKRQPLELSTSLVLLLSSGEYARLSGSVCLAVNRGTNHQVVASLSKRWSDPSANLHVEMMRGLSCCWPRLAEQARETFLR